MPCVRSHGNSKQVTYILSEYKATKIFSLLYFKYLTQILLLQLRLLADCTPFAVVISNSAEIYNNVPPNVALACALQKSTIHRLLYMAKLLFTIFASCE
jgi:hypothetical protein